MSCTFILGRRGAGKTRCLYDMIFEKISAGEGPLYLLIPEQATFLHEKSIDAARDGRSLWDLEITSFTRLAKKYVQRQSLNKLGQKLLLYQVLKENRERLETFGKSLPGSGFLDEVLSALTEIGENLLKPADLQNIAASLAARNDIGDLPEKLRDMAVLQEAVAEKRDPRSLWDGEMLRLFIGEAKHAFADAHFFFDDFYDFTALEYRILEALLASGADLTFSLLYDCGEPLLQKSADCFHKLKQMAPLHRILRLRRQEEGPAELAYLERHYGDAGPSHYDGPTAALRLFWGQDQRSEVEGAAQQICALLARGCPRGDIGVYLRATAGYDRLIAEIFPAYGLAYDLSEAHALADSPLFRYLRDFLHLFRERWSFPSLMQLIKNGLYPLAPEETDRFENYCLAHAIKGRRFYQEEDWPYVDEEADLTKINALRRGIAAFLRPFEKALRAAKTMPDYGAVLWDFLEQSGVHAVLSVWAETETREGRPLKARELLESYDTMVDILEQLAAAFPEEIFSLEDVCDLLEIAFSEAQMKSIPLSSHHIEVGVLGLSRLERKRVVFLLGVNEGVFPAPLERGSLFHLDDREILSSLGDFWPQNRDFFAEQENMLTYQALTGAAEQLYVSFSQTGGGEGVLGPSLIVYRLEQLFPALVREEKTWLPGSGSDEDFLWSLPKALHKMGWALGEGQARWQPVADHFHGLPDYRLRTAHILTALTYRNIPKPLGRETMEQKYPGDLFLNVSALEAYRRCPFSYFAKYGLRLKERKELVFKAPDIGNIFHEALRMLAEKMAEAGADWTDLGMEGPRIITAVTDEIMAGFGEDNLFSPEQAAFICRRIKENLLLLVEIMAEQVREGDRFRPVGWEVAFGPDRELAGQRFRLPFADKEIILTGQIDRVDRAEEGGRSYFRVIDYKTGNMKLQLDDIYHGVKIQLLLYMMMVEKNIGESAGGEAAGIFYFSARDFFLSADAPMEAEAAKARLMQEAKLNGYLIGGDEVAGLAPALSKRRLTKEEYDRLRRHLRQMIEEIGGEIISGENAISPYMRKGERSCAYCPYLSLCGFDGHLGNKLRYLHGMKDDAVWERLGIKEGDGDALDGKSKKSH